VRPADNTFASMASGSRPTSGKMLEDGARIAVVGAGPAGSLFSYFLLNMADTLGLSPYPLMMGVSLAASAAFMTPFSHKANLLVMGAGGYRSGDYLRVGTPLTLMLFVLLDGWNLVLGSLITGLR